MRADGNNIDIDAESNPSRRKRVFFQSTAQLLTNQFAGLEVCNIRRPNKRWVS